MWFLFGEVSSSSGCLGWAMLFYCGTPGAFNIIILYLFGPHSSNVFISECRIFGAMKAEISMHCAKSGCSLFIRCASISAMQIL